MTLYEVVAICVEFYVDTLELELRPSGWDPSET